MSVVRFLKYNNAVPVTISLLLLSFAGALAASPGVRTAAGEALYSEVATVLSVDNTYIAGKNLDSFTPRVEILAVSEDAESYFILFRFYTIGIKNYIWQDVSAEETMTVSKSVLQGRDLGLYVTEQLKQRIDRELAFLREVQEIERRQVTQKTVAVAYGGLVGKLLDDTTESLPGYVPVVLEPAQPPRSEVPPQQPAPSSETPQPSPPTPSATPITPADQGSLGQSGAPPAPPEAPSDTIPPTLQVLGDNPARIPVGGTYTELGVAVTDNVNSALSYLSFVNDTLMSSVALDTSAPREYVILYQATDSAGNVGYARRSVIVYEETLSPPPPVPEEGGASSAPEGSEGGEQESSAPEPAEATTAPAPTTP